jgi:hypothetical protein
MNAVDPTATIVPESAEQPGELSIEQVEEILSYDLTVTAGNGTHNGGSAVVENGVKAGHEPTLAAPREAVAPMGPAQPIGPIVTPGPIVIKRLVSGRYRAVTSGIHVELRVDVDGTRPMRRVSADYYIVSGATVNYFGSMIVNTINVAVTATTVTITGTGTYTWSAGAPVVRITVPRVSIFSPPAAATLQHLTTSNSPGATYTCNWESRFFRTLTLEEDREAAVTQFNSYNTGSLPSGGSARTLSVASAYAEAGIEMLLSPRSDVVNIGEAGNGIWSNAELHASMERHFSLYRNAPQWAVWLFHALKHDLGPGLLGIMFDQQGLQRQGAAVFYQSQGGSGAAQQRNQLYTCVHELGHCFNLYHSFHKQYMNPPQPNRLHALSWMNYPQNYQPVSGTGGSAAFWASFPFQFDDLELIHLRHAFRNNVIMGGANFGIGAALLDPQEWNRSPIVDNSGLKLELSAPRSFMLGAPVSVQLTITLTDMRGREVHRHLKPANGFVDIAISKPGGQIVLYRAPLHECVADETTMLTADQPQISADAYIGYGKDGLYFDQAGRYQIRALYYSTDGSLVLSNVLDVRISNPLTSEDAEVADLLTGDEQGMLFYLMGSDALPNGNAAFDEIIDRFGDHELAGYVRLAKGVNAAREFKTVEADGTLSYRAPDMEQATSLLAPVVDLTAARGALGGAPDGGGAAMASAVKDGGNAGLQHFVRAQSAEIAAELGS